MDIKKGLKELVLGLLKEKIDLSTVDGLENGIWLPVIYKEDQKGNMQIVANEEIINKKETNTLIPFNLLGTVSENRLGSFTSDQFLKQYTGAFTLEILVPIDDEDVYGEIFERLEKFRTDTLNVYYDNFKIDNDGEYLCVLTSNDIQEDQGTIQLIDSVEYKRIRIFLLSDIIKGVINSRNREFTYNGEVIPCLNKEFSYTKTVTETTISGVKTAKTIPDQGLVTIGMVIPLNVNEGISSEVLKEVLDSNAESVSKTYSIGSLYNLPTEGLSTVYDMVLVNYEEVMNDGVSMLISLTFRERGD